MAFVALRVGCATILLALAATTPMTGPARAVPAFAVQTGQPCAACHVGAFGPQLKPFGRDFKLHGYVGNDGQDHGLPLALTARTSFTHTRDPQPSAPEPGFKPNDNYAIEGVSLYYAGRIGSQAGAFIKGTFDGIDQKPRLDNFDIRYAGEGKWFDGDLVWGLTVNNGPTVSDPWNSTPIWGFPYNRSYLAPKPMAATLVDGGLTQRVGGAGAYLFWNNLVYAEVDVYKGLGGGALRILGQETDERFQTNAVIPYARLALVRDWGNHHAQVGAFFLTGKVLPGDDQTFGYRLRATDIAADANYQYIFDSAKVTSDMVSAHATFIHEDSSIDGQAQGLFGRLQHSLNTFRFDVSYSFAATITPSVQYFRTTGTADPTYWSTLNGRPNSDGMIFEVAYVPWGKPDSPFPNVNVRLAVQYINYFTFDGTSTNAGANNTFYFSLWAAMKL